MPFGAGSTEVGIPDLRERLRTHRPGGPSPLPARLFQRGWRRTARGRQRDGPTHGSPGIRRRAAAGRRDPASAAGRPGVLGDGAIRNGGPERDPGEERGALHGRDDRIGRLASACEGRTLTRLLTLGPSPAGRRRRAPLVPVSAAGPARRRIRGLWEKLDVAEGDGGELVDGQAGAATEDKGKGRRRSSGAPGLSAIAGRKRGMSGRVLPAGSSPIGPATSRLVVRAPSPRARGVVLRRPRRSPAGPEGGRNGVRSGPGLMVGWGCD